MGDEDMMEPRARTWRATHRAVQTAALDAGCAVLLTPSVIKAETGLRSIFLILPELYCHELNVFCFAAKWRVAGRS